MDEFEPDELTPDQHIEEFKNDPTKYFDQSDQLIFAILTDYIEKVPENQVIDIASSVSTEASERFQMNYLKALREKKRLKENMKRLAELVLKFDDPSKKEILRELSASMLTTLKDEALNNQDYNGAAFISQLLGSKVQGLEILLKHVPDPKYAVTYARDVDDKEVYSKLVQHSYNNKEYLIYVMEKLPSLHMNPVKFVEKIPPKMSGEIENFNELREKLLQELERKAKTSEIVQSIVHHNRFHHYQEAEKEYKRAVVVTFN